MLPVPLWVPEPCHPRPHLGFFPHLRTGLCHVQAGRRQRGSPAGGWLFQHLTPWQDKCKNMKSFWCWGQITWLRGLPSWLSGFHCLRRLRH